MTDHNKQLITTREMVRDNTYPFLAAVGSLSLLSIVILQIPQAVKAHRYNRCINTQIMMRQAINPQNRNHPGHMHYLKAVEHCEGR